MHESLEIERKYEAGPAATPANLQNLAGVSAVGEARRYDLAATYYDTADLRLLHSGVTLRRRTGGHDPGWHLKLPAPGDGRRELSWPLSLAAAADGPPREVLDPVLGLVRLLEVVPIATIDTIRMAYELFDADGAVIAEVADDAVVGTRLVSLTDPGSAPVVTVWREIEVEVVADLTARAAHPALAALLLESADVLLGSSGIQRSEAPSKLARVLADVSPARTGKRSPRHSTAGEVVVDYLAAQVAALLRADLGARTGDSEGVHDFRVACRRLRSAMASYGSVLERPRTNDVRAELQWIAAQLSEARDQQVAIDHLRAVIAVQPPELIIGPVVERLSSAAQQRRSGQQVPEALRQHRYFALLDALDAMVADPPLTKRSSRKAGPTLAADVAHGFARLHRSVEFARSQTGGQRDLALHDVRKAAKRVRSAAEVAVPVADVRRRKGLSSGRNPIAVEALARQIQDLLGARQDTLVTRRECQRLGALADDQGESSWTYGLLYQLEAQRADAAEKDFWELWGSAVSA